MRSARINVGLVLSTIVATIGALWPEPASASDSPQAAMRGGAHGAPVILDGAYHSEVFDTRDAREPRRDYLLLRLDPDSVQGARVILEPVWGAATRPMAHIFGRTHLVRDGYVYAHPHCRGARHDQPFTLGLRVRVVHRDGSLSPPSLPIFIHHQGDARSEGGIRSDQVLLVLVSAALFFLWLVYRRERDSEARIRLAAATALSALLFLTATPAMRWMQVQDPTGELPAVDCSLGDEQQCATYVPDGGPNPLAASSVSAPRRTELAQWIAFSASVRSGLVLSLLLLLPALIWLLVVPRLRAAQCAVFIGATAAGYTMLTTILYLFTVPDWMATTAYRTGDVALLCCSAIVIATGLILRESFRFENRPELPAATVHHALQ